MENVIAITSDSSQAVTAFNKNKCLESRQLMIDGGSSCGCGEVRFKLAFGIFSAKVSRLNRGTGLAKNLEP